MYRYPTKLFLAGGVAVALLALGTISIHSPTRAQEPGGGPLACAEGQGAIFSVTNTWECRDIIPPDKIVFLSSTTTDGAIIGTAGADEICNDLAFDAELQGMGDFNFLAWISDNGSSPDTLFVQHPGRYVLLNGTIVAYEWDDLTNGNVNNPIDIDEMGQMVGEVNVWTGTRADGTGIGAFTCLDWTSNVPAGSGAPRAMAGVSTATGIGWTQDVQKACDSFLRLYCFEQ